MSRFTIAQTIEQLDPEKDNQRIVFLSSRHDFPFDTTRALEFALFRTFCVPSISALLDCTGEFAQRPQKRYDDTDIIVSELMEWGYDGERGQGALRRLNQLHGRFAIANEDFLYVLSTFVYEPIRWNQRFGWRAMNEVERRGYFYFWREVGRRMNIKNIPPDYGRFEQFNLDYEARHCRYSEANQRVGSATRELMVSWFPRFLAPLVRSAIYSLLDHRALAAFGFPPPIGAVRWLIIRALRLRGWCASYFPSGLRPRLRTEMVHRSYPAGYRIEDLGPPRK
ncbi:MAG TPA: oxygenase MpaB family protein [Candidatus Limnocylindria bacterium]|nr:oxygenase MpaB family protein [Candidatus Limnocylindria bacterium]